MTKPLPFTEASIRRAVKGARKAGLRVIGIRSDGTVMVQDGDEGHGALPQPRPLRDNAPPPSKWEDLEQ